MRGAVHAGCLRRTAFALSLKLGSALRLALELEKFIPYNRWSGVPLLRGSGPGGGVHPSSVTGLVWIMYWTA